MDSNDVVYVHWRNAQEMLGRAVHLVENKVVYSVVTMHPERRFKTEVEF